MATTPFDVTTPKQPAVGAYVRARTRRRLRIAMLIPLAAALATAAILVNRPVPYESRLRVVIPEELGTGSSAVGLYLANLEQRLIDPDVVDHVVAETSVDPGDYVAGIRLERIGQSSDAEFGFTAHDPDTARDVVETAASAALRSLAKEGLPFARREVKLAERSYRQAVAALDEFRLEHGVSYPQEQYRQVVTELQEAEADLEKAEALGDTDGAQRLSAAIKRLEKDRTKLERTLPEYQQLDDARMVALELRSRARDRLASKQAEIRLSDQANLRRDVATRQVSRRRIVLQGAAAAAGLALFLELAVIVLPDLLRPTRRSAWRTR